MNKNIENSSEENIDFYSLLLHLLKRPLRISYLIYICICLVILALLLAFFLSDNVLSIWRIIVCVGFIILACLMATGIKKKFYNSRIYTVENFEKDYEYATEYVKNSNKNKDIPKEYYSSGYQMIHQFLIEKEQTYLNSQFYIEEIKSDLNKKMIPELKLTPINRKNFKKYMDYEKYLNFEYPKPLLQNTFLAVIAVLMGFLLILYRIWMEVR